LGRDGHRRPRLAWAVDHNLTRTLSSGDSVQIATVKGVSPAAGSFELRLQAAGRAPPGL
jgi:hypothetical protein